MQQRLNISKLAPDLYRAIRALDGAIRDCGLDTHLLHLVKLRASQVNGCAFCVDMHVKEALDSGFTHQKLHLVAAWRESAYFTERERAALEWTESVTLLADSGIPDAAYDIARAAFTDTEIAQLTVAIGTINLLNRLAVGSRMQHPVE
ncbi:carboxymuconolactone decarboxylase family protein [Stappia sp.]|uniref:carboxymuconolactone decarboxylase family protein n=1 Tax=Stappia sp. TaxID=1870903 RepID=UPI003A9A15D7